MTASAYLAEKHQQLADDYRADCLAIAKELAALLLNEGRRPYLITMVRLEMRGENRFYNRINPLRYGGRITWTRHYACGCAGQIYDPLFAEPVDESKFAQRAFGVEIPMEIFVSEANLADYLSRHPVRNKPVV